MKHAKILPITVNDVVPLMKTMDEAKLQSQIEFGVCFSAAKPGQVGDEVGEVVLFREHHHSDKDIEIAAARINALYFCVKVYVTDLVINKAA